MFRKKKTSSSSVPKLVFTYQNNQAGDCEEEIITTDTEPEIDLGNHLNVEPDTMSIISKHSSLDVRSLIDRMETVRVKRLHSKENALDLDLLTVKLNILILNPPST